MAAGFDVLTATTADIQAGYETGALTAVSVLGAYLAQIDRHEAYLHSIIELAPRSLLLETAKKLDEERQKSGPRSPLHAVPVLVKDNIDTHPDLGVESTTAGSCALRGSRPKASSPAIEKVRKLDQHAWASCLHSTAGQGWGDYSWKDKYVSA
jgi:amidase